MGLDITAYSNLRHVGIHEFDKERNEGEPGPWCYYEHHVMAFAYDAFPRSFRGIPVIGPSPVEGFIWGGCYEITEGTDTHGFRAGSYSGYGAWRNSLRSQFNPDEDPDLPFYELIYFADNEGCIGSEAAADLLLDFRSHATSYEPPWPWASEVYGDWIRAFELAANGGLVDFH